ncbi:MAG: hypothetical protein HQ536_03450, partial [Parcubacteria group bacterium]|nr:hypothetical protein [Parcubacteria group bacterium]
PYNTLKQREVCLKIEDIRTSKKTAIEIFRALSGFVAAFLLIVFCAFGLRFIEIQISDSVNSAMAAPLIERSVNKDTENCSVKDILEEGYLKVTGLFNKNTLHKLLGIKTAHAAAPYQAMKLIQSAENLDMAASEKQLFIIGLKNTGTKNWYRDENRFVSIYTYSPKYRTSKFEDESWYDSIQPAKLKSEVVKPGEIGYIEFFLKAPEKIGEYTETFRLAAEDTAWIDGGVFSVSINVSDKPSLQAIKLLQSHKEMTLKQGEVGSFRVGFKNTGRVDWVERTIARNDLEVAATGAESDTSLFVDSSWVDSLKPIVTQDGVVKPGQLGFLDFKIKAPQRAGQFNLKFALVIGGEYVEGGEIELPVTVTNERLAGTSPGVVSAVPVIPLGPEPNVRIGLFYKTEAEYEPTYVVANGDYEVRDASLNLLTHLPPRVRATLNYDFDTRTYSIEVSGSTFTSTEHLRIIPTLPTTLEITNFENRPAWNRSLNDNVFRGTLEYRFISDEIARLWVINDISMEYYIRGLAESMSTDHLEYQKALATAARTYAYYHFANGGKHPKQSLTLNASAGDQVYKGYNSEIRLPNHAQAVDETRGMAVTYGGKVVVTPYFAKSSGRTRTWTQAWGGASKPWLPSRSAPYDAAAGRTLWGHGVGMSQRDARDRAEDGFNFLQILDAYYTGIQVAKIY